ncbi:MAG TPA: hypothetical protein VMZ53_27465 [Kofleriaceae bacterium]|nr:hypothetical protein [Kofleriaceae bacterium]
MVRIALILLALAACKREKAGPGASGGPGSGVVTAGSASTGSAATTAASGSAGSGSATVAGPIDLLHAIPVRMAVSSLVANPKVSAYDLVDGDLATAWNSKTGQLKGAWIAFRVPPSTHVDAIELTVGFVSKGAEGDYFTLNPRIKSVAVWHDGIRLREVELDINKRELQKVPVDANGGDYKLEVTAFEPGSKKNWREICVSELRVIGTPAPGTKTGDYSPSISIASLDAEPLPEPNVTLEVLDGFASVAEFCDAFKKRKPAPCAPWDEKCEKTPEPSTCGDAVGEPLTLPQLPSGWKATWFASYLGNSKVAACNLAIEAKGRFYVLERIGGNGAIGSASCGQAIDMQLDLAKPTRSRSDIRVEDVMGTPDKELVLLTTVPGDIDPMDSNKLPFTEQLHICSATPSGEPACMKAKLGQLDVKNASGDDGYAQWLEAAWLDDFAIEHGQLVITRKSGKAESYEQDLAPGRYRLKLPD